MSERLCEDCPPFNYSTDKTRCLPCPRRRSLGSVPSTCIEHQAGRPTLRLSFQIKVF